MIDPDNIQIQNNNLPSTISITNVNEFDIESYDLNDDKDFNKYITDIERIIRGSFEYRSYIKYLKDYMGMDKCAFIKGVSNKETYDIKIEIHHYPFTLRDIVQIVVNKRAFNHESLSVFMVAKEVMSLHYKSLVGLVPLSETVHELAHSGRIFIPTDIVFGRYKLFIQYYEQFIDPQLIDQIERAEYHSMNHTELLDTTIIDTNKISYNITDNRFRLPEFKNVTNDMINQIQAIKDNNYLLPTPEDVNNENKPEEALIFLVKNKGVV